MMESFENQWVVQLILGIIIVIISALLNYWFIKKPKTAVIILLFSLVSFIAGVAIVKMYDPTSELVPVPDMYGKYEDAAKVMLKKIGLECKIKYDENTSVTEGKVFRQEPSSGTLVALMKRSCVKVFISGSPMGAPDVIGMKEGKAYEELKERIGSGVSIATNRKHSNRPEGEVIDQNPKAGTLVGEDSLMTITVSMGE